jgi:hypothetical protein
VGAAFGGIGLVLEKSKRKLLTVAKESPEWFDFPAEMERKYSKLKAENAHGKRVFFRGNESTADILRQAKTTKFTPYSDSLQRTFFEFDDFLDIGSGCGESCEIGADE